MQRQKRKCPLRKEGSGPDCHGDLRGGPSTLTLPYRMEPDSICEEKNEQKALFSLKERGKLHEAEGLI